MGGLAVKVNGRFKRTYDLTSSVVPRGTSFHRSVELEFPPILIGRRRRLRLREGLGNSGAPTPLGKGAGVYATQRSFNGPIGSRGHEVKCWWHFQRRRLDRYQGDYL